MSEKLKKCFESFAAFGTGKGTEPAMDQSKWAKCYRDCKLIDEKFITDTDVDIVFNKVKAKAERKINFKEFQTALKELGKLKHADLSYEDRVDRIYKLVEDSGSHINDVTKSSNPADNKVVDTSKYTGVYKEKFDESGKGKGMEGREQYEAKSGYVGSSKE